MWWYIPRIYSWPHRKILSLEINTCVEGIDAKTMDRIFQLIDQGVHIRILDRGKDYLQQSTQGTDLDAYSLSSSLFSMTNTLFGGLWGVLKFLAGWGCRLCEDCASEK